MQFWLVYMATKKHSLQDHSFQQDTATAHIANSTMELLQEIFGKGIISQNV
jgi:hypothetical protein